MNQQPHATPHVVRLPSFDTELVRTVLDLARQGLASFPCNPSPGSESKKPLVAGGFKAATCDEAQLREWFGSRFPRALIGVPTGERSGFWVLDPDRPKAPGASDGEAAVAGLEARHGALPATRTDYTPGGGRHFTSPGTPSARSGARAAISRRDRCAR